MARVMKDSGIAWVNNIPLEWDVMANKYIMTKIKHVNPLYQGEDILSLTMNGVIIRDLDAGKCSTLLLMVIKLCILAIC